MEFQNGQSVIMGKNWRIHNNKVRNAKVTE